MNEDSIWRKGWTYVILTAVAIAGIWWVATQTSALPLKDGDYSCQAVFVNEETKYEIVVDAEGGGYPGYATVQAGELSALGGDSDMNDSDLARLTVRTKGSSHFHVTDDPAMHSYYAMACDYSGA